MDKPVDIGEPFNGSSWRSVSPAELMRFTVDGELIACLLYYDDARGVWNRVREEQLGNLPERVAAMIGGKMYAEPKRWGNETVPVADADFLEPAPFVKLAVFRNIAIHHDEIPDDRGEARKLLSGKLMAMGDALWAEMCKLKGWEG